jgi:hypothetical protein
VQRWRYRNIRFELDIMVPSHTIQRVVILVAIIAAALVSSSCTSSAGIGVGAGYPAVWGSGGTGPPVFVGGFPGY